MAGSNLPGPGCLLAAPGPLPAQQAGDTAPGGAASQAQGSAAPGENNGVSLPRPLSQGQQWQEPELPELISPLRARGGPGQAGGCGLCHKGSLSPSSPALLFAHGGATPAQLRSDLHPPRGPFRREIVAAFWGYRELPSAPFGPPLLLPCGLGTHGPLLAAARLPDPPSSCFVSRCARALSAGRDSGSISPASFLPHARRPPAPQTLSWGETAHEFCSRALGHHPPAPAVPLPLSALLQKFCGAHFVLAVKEVVGQRESLGEGRPNLLLDTRESPPGTALKLGSPGGLSPSVPSARTDFDPGDGAPGAGEVSGLSPRTAHGRRVPPARPARPRDAPAPVVSSGGRAGTGPRTGRAGTGIPDRQSWDPGRGRDRPGGQRPGEGGR